VAKAQKVKNLPYLTPESSLKNACINFRITKDIHIHNEKERRHIAATTSQTHG